MPHTTNKVKAATKKMVINHGNKKHVTKANVTKGIATDRKNKKHEIYRPELPRPLVERIRDILVRKEKVISNCMEISILKKGEQPIKNTFFNYVEMYISNEKNGDPKSIGLTNMNLNTIDWTKKIYILKMHDWGRIKAESRIYRGDDFYNVNLASYYKHFEGIITFIDKGRCDTEFGEFAAYEFKRKV